MGSFVVIAFGQEISRSQVLGFCARVRALLVYSEADAVICDLDTVACPSGVTLDVLARLQLTASRLGRDLRLRNTCHELECLLEFAGLAAVVGMGPERLLGARGQAEQRKQPGGVEEEREPGDLPI
ncbi:MAG: STAS domain-containing protein [Acidimicrobiia bacterium]